MAGIVPDPRQKTGNASLCEGGQDLADVGWEVVGRGMRLLSPPQRSKGVSKPVRIGSFFALFDTLPPGSWTPT